MLRQSALLIAKYEVLLMKYWWNQSVIFDHDDKSIEISLHCTFGAQKLREMLIEINRNIFVNPAGWRSTSGVKGGVDKLSWAMVVAMLLPKELIPLWSLIITASSYNSCPVIYGSNQNRGLFFVNPVDMAKLIALCTYVDKLATPVFYGSQWHFIDSAAPVHFAQFCWA